MKAPRVLFIDTSTLKLLSSNDSIIHSVFQSTINVLVKDTIITVSSRASKSKHTIIIDPIDLSILGLKPQGRVTIKDNVLMIQNIRFTIELSALESRSSYTKTFQITEQTINLLDDLKDWIQKQDKPSLYRFDSSDVLLRYQFGKIDTFLLEPTLQNATKLIGLGIGLTPIGDDVLLGYLLAKQTINQHIPFRDSLISESFTKTNLISAQMLQDVYQYHYADHYIDLIEGLFIHHTIEPAYAFASFGGSSGLAILTGFIQGLTERKINHD